MKRWIYGTWSLIVVMALAGCAAVGQGASPTGDAGRSPGPSLSENYANALPAATQLVVGTLKLDGTDLAVTPQQAQQLLPLWEAYRTLSTSQTAAPQETAALVTQIQETMTAAQLSGIADMKLTTADFQSVFSGRNPQGQGQFGGTQAPGQGGTPQSGGTRRGNGGGGFAGGGFAGGGGGGFEGGGGFFPGGGGGFAGGSAGGSSALAPAQTPNPQALATARAQRSGTSGANPALVGFLIQYLQQKSGGTPTSGSTASSTPAAASASAATSTSVATPASAATAMPVATSTPAATSASAVTSTLAATSTPAAGGG
jgi:hypothetical protein